MLALQQYSTLQFCLEMNMAYTLPVDSKQILTLSTPQY